MTFAERKGLMQSRGRLLLEIAVKGTHHAQLLSITWGESIAEEGLRDRCHRDGLPRMFS